MKICSPFGPQFRFYFSKWKKSAKEKGNKLLRLIEHAGSREPHSHERKWVRQYSSLFQGKAKTGKKNIENKNGGKFSIESRAHFRI